MSSGPLKKRGREEEEQLNSEEDVWAGDLMGDAADRARLAQMSMLDREMELDRRRQVRDSLRERNEAMRRLENKTAGGGEGKRGKMDLRAQRDARFDQFMSKEKGSMYAGDDDDEDEEDAEEGEVGDMDVDAEDEWGAGRDVGHAVPLSEVLKIQARRSTLVSWQDRPVFEKAAEGMYVKVRVGDSDGKGVYRMARVTKVERRNTQYKLIGEETEKSNVHLLCSIGKATKRFKLVQVSNQDISPDEFKVYTHKQNSDNLSLPGDKEVKAKLRDVSAAVNYKRSEEELAAKLEEILEKPLEELTVVQLKDKRAEAEGLLREAKDNKDREEVNNITQQLARIRELLEEKNPIPRNISQGSRYNARVKKKRMDPKDADEYYGEDDLTKANPFRRRRTVSSAMIVKTATQEVTPEETEEVAPVLGKEDIPEAEPVDEDVAKLQRSNVIVKRLGKSPKALAAQIAGEHDFELDIDI